MKKRGAHAIDSLHQEITACDACPRLRSYCRKVASEKRRAFMSETYWGKPIAGFGDPRAAIHIVGLAPAAHGANRTGRIFTGDRSGEWLYRALHKAGFANQPFSRGPGDGLRLQGLYISCVVRCAPPDNRPLPRELERCSGFMKREIELLGPSVKLWIALGGIALKGLLPHLRALFPDERLKTPRFSHGGETLLPDGRHLLLSYHPSQQNTFTGRLTEPMFDSIFSRAREIVGS